MRTRHNQSAGRAILRRAGLSAALAAMFAAPASVWAFEIPTGNEDLAMRFDNTIRYNLGIRTQSQDRALLGNVNLDDGNRNFNVGDIVTNRFDGLTEFDIIWKRQFGARVSGAWWYDWAYGSLDNKSTATANTLVNGLPVAGVLSPYTKRYAEGFSGEFLDAFVFANFDAGDVAINVKAGQHTVYWGDSLLGGGAIHGVSYAQNSLDLGKALSTPGTEAKELFRPKGGVTLQVQATPELSIAGQWFYNWQAARLPESGAYLTIQDALFFGGDSLITGPNPFAALVPGSPALARLWRGQDIVPGRPGGNVARSTDSGLNDWGLSARWSPAWLDGTLGFYYRHATDILPQVMVTPGLAANVPPATCNAIGGQPLPGNACIINRNATTLADIQKFGKVGLYNLAWGDDIKIYGITLSKNLGGISFGTELSYRQNMPLNSDPVTVLPAPLVPTTPGAIATTAVPTSGTPGALGSTWHGIINAIGILPKTALFDTATYQAELVWNQWADVTQNMAVFKGRSGYNLIDRVSKNFWGLAINFTPTWFQVFPGVDILAPLTWSQGIHGNSAVSSGGNEDVGTYSVGLAADIYQKYRIDLKYNAYFGDYTRNAAGAAAVTNGSISALVDRGWVSLTFKTTF